MNMDGDDRENSMKQTRIPLALAGATLALSFAVAHAAEGFAVLGADQLGQYWVHAPQNEMLPRLPSVHEPGPDQVCLAMGFSIDAKGRATGAKPLTRYSSTELSKQTTRYWRQFDKSAVTLVNSWRFSPAPTAVKPQPAYTVAYLVFANEGQTRVLNDGCKIPDLVAFIKQAQSRKEGDRNMRGMADNQQQNVNMQREAEANLRRANNGRP